MNIDIVIPCYNENKNLEKILKKIEGFKNLKYLKFILVNNGSTDNSFKNKKIIKFLKLDNVKNFIIFLFLNDLSVDPLFTNIKK